MNTIYKNDLFTFTYISIFIFLIAIFILARIIVWSIKKKEWPSLRYILIVFSLCVVGFGLGAILLTVLALLGVIVYAIITERRGGKFVNTITLVVLSLITSTLCLILPMNIMKDVKLENALKNETCSIVEGEPTLIEIKQAYYRDEFVGYTIDFAVNDQTFKDLEQEFPLEVLTAIREGQKLKVYFYQDEKEIIILRIDTI